MTQLELGQVPEGKSCAWCGELATLVFQASPCCAGCAGAGAKWRVTAWLQRMGSRLKR